MNRKWWRSLLVVSVVTMLVLAACSNNTGDESPSARLTNETAVRWGRFG